MNDWPQPSEPPDRDRERRRGRTLVFPVGRNGSRRLLVTLAVGLCAIAAGVSVAAVPSPTGSSSPGAAGRVANASHRSTAPAVRATQETAPGVPGRSATGPGNTSDGIAKTALRWPRGLKQQIAHWNAGPGGAALSDVTEQLGNAMQAIAVRLYPMARVTCVSLGSSIETARTAPPIPDAAMQRLYAKVLVGLSGAAADCRNAISVHQEGDETARINLNKVLLSRSMAEFAAESNLLYTATAEIRTLPR